MRTYTDEELRRIIDSAYSMDDNGDLLVVDDVIVPLGDEE